MLSEDDSVVLSDDESKELKNDSDPESSPFVKPPPFIPDTSLSLDDGEDISLTSDDLPPSRLRLSEPLDEPPTFQAPSYHHESSTSHTTTASVNAAARAAAIAAMESPYIFTISISKFEKRGEGINAYIAYQVRSETRNVPGMADRCYEVWRRFSDFLGLHDKLVEKHLPKGVVVPPAPEKSIAAMTKTKTSSDVMLDDVAARRARQLARFMRRIVEHPRMRADCDVRDFVSLEAVLPRASQTAALSSAGVMRMFKSVGEVFSKIAFHMEEGDRWFEQTQSHVEDLDEALRKLLSLTEGLANTRKELSYAQENMSKGLSMLASCEESTALARVFSHLTETEENAAAIWAKQSENDTIKLSECISEYVGLIGSLKDLLNERVRVWQTWQTAQQNLVKKRDIKAKMELNGRSDKVATLKDEMDDATAKMDQLETEFKELSKLIREEYGRFEVQRRKDMKQLLIDYLQGLIDTHTEMLHVWEKFEPETRIIIP